MNYLKNSYRQPGAQNDFKKVWDIVFKIHNDERNEKTNKNGSEAKPKQVGGEGGETSSHKRTNAEANGQENDNSKKSKKQKVDGAEEKIETDKCTKNGKKELTEWKSWKNAIRTTLRNQKDRQGEMKSIRKIVLKLYKKLCQDYGKEEKSKKELKNLFLEKVKKDKKIELRDDGSIVKLI